MSQRHPPTMLGFLELPQLVQVVILFAAFIAFAYSVETERYTSAGLIIGLFIYYFTARRRYRRYHRQISGKTMTRRDFYEQRRAKRDVDGDAPDD